MRSRERKCIMRQFRCDSETMKKGYMALAAQVSKAIEKGTLSVYDTLNLVVIDDVVVNWYGNGPFAGRYIEEPKDVLLQMVARARYEFERPYFEEHSTSTLAELSVQAVKNEGHPKSVVNEVFTDREAAKLWEVGLTAVIKACQGTGSDTFTEQECRDSEGTFLVSATGMNRLFGVRLADEDMSIVFLHIGKEEAMLVRSKLREQYVQQGLANVEDALKTRLTEVITSCVKEIANGRTAELLRVIENMAREVGIKSRVAEVVTDFRRYNRIVWAYLYALVDSDEVEVWHNSLDGEAGATKAGAKPIANTQAQPTSAIGVAAGAAIAQEGFDGDYHNPLLDAYNDELLEEHGFKAEARERSQSQWKQGSVDESALTESITYEDLIDNVFDTDLSNLTAKEEPKK